MEPKPTQDAQSEVEKNNKKMPVRFLILLAVLAALVGAAIYVNNRQDDKSTNKNVSNAENVGLSLSPASQNVTKDEKFTVSVWEDSGNQDTNAVQASLTYPADKLELVKIDSSSSPFEVEAQSTGKKGKIVIARGHVGSLVGRQLVAKLTFKVIGDSGNAAVDFSDDSALVSAANNQNIASQLSGGSYTIGGSE